MSSGGIRFKHFTAAALEIQMHGERLGDKSIAGQLITGKNQLPWGGPLFGIEQRKCPMRCQNEPVGDLCGKNGKIDSSFTRRYSTQR